MMHGHEKSRSAIVAVKPTNNAERSAAEQSAAEPTAAESVERRAGTKGNVGQQRTRRTQRRISVSQMLARIRQHIVAVDTQGGNRMRESCMYGSVRGVRGNSHPYRDRREFISLLGGVAAVWPLAARAQQLPAIRRIGALMDTSEDNPDGQGRYAAFRRGLQELGWTEGRTIRIDVRWGGGDVARTRAYAAELVALKPDVIFAFANAQLSPLSRETRNIPIVFVGASDPVGAGYVASFAHPGGNITGFTLFEASMVGKWLAVLKEIAPAIARVALLV